MKPILIGCICLLLKLGSAAQKEDPNRGKKPLAPAVILYENPDFSGQSKRLEAGTYRLSDFNDITSSVRVPAGFVALIYEHADDGGGYGISVDLMEDCPDLSRYNFNDKTSYIIVFNSIRFGTPEKPGNLYYARNRTKDNQFVPGHWEREMANGQRPDNSIVVVSPPIASQAPANPSMLAVSGPTTTITSLGVQSIEGRALWERAMNDQMGIIGNDYRGSEEIGSACFERASNNPAIPDLFNFWYPQRQKNDNRSVIFFKRTLAGRVKESKQWDFQGTFADYDVEIDIVPNPKYMYLVNDAHPREYTSLMAAQWKLSGAIPLVEQSGLPDCDAPETIEEFSQLEAEIAEDHWPKGNNTFGRARIADLCLQRTGKDMCVYGTWIYDRGHCCHPEIHPAEQLWWMEPQANGKKYNLNVVCDASGRFWWRKQMDDGSKLKPWGAPPVKGLFAIAFEYTIPQVESALGYSTRQFEADYIQHYNLIEYPDANQTYTLVYQNRNIVTFIPHNAAFKVSFEQVGTVPEAPNKIRGFLVIETSVGLATQIATSIAILNGTTPQVISLPANSSPEQAPEKYEDRFFKKEEGHYYFTITETSVNSGGRKFDKRENGRMN
jgi:hypothetical protein